MTRKKTFKVTERSLWARDLAISLMRKHGLGDCFFAFNNRARVMGLCVRYRDGRPGQIELSVRFCEVASDEEIRDTILHEIAHMICVPGEGHGPAWKAKCLEIGAVPKRCGHVNFPMGNWVAVCPVCCKIYNRYRRPRSLTGWRCSQCPSKPTIAFQKNEEPAKT